AVHDALTELGLGGKLLVEMQRLHVHRERAEQHVVHLRDRSCPGMVERTADRQFLEIEPCHLPPRESHVSSSTDGRWAIGHRINAATGRNSKMRSKRCGP